MLWFIITALANAVLWTELSKRWDLTLTQKLCGVALTALVISTIMTHYGFKI